MAVSNEAQKLIHRCRRLLYQLGWKGHPFFLIPSSKVRIRATALLPTAAADPRGYVYMNPAFAATLDDGELKFVLAHELMHLLMMHYGRRGNRLQRRWNRAADRVINFALCTIKDIKAPKSALLPLDTAHEGFSAEEAYEVEPEQQGDHNPFGANDMPLPTAGCGPRQVSGGGDGGGDGSNNSVLPGEGEEPDDGRVPSMPEAARIWRQTAASAQAQAKAADRSMGAGTGVGSMLARLLEAPPSRVKWSALLRGTCSRAEAQAGRDDVAWSRRHRRSFGGDFILPGPISYSCAVAAVVDTSGSVPEKSIAQAVSEIQKIAETSRVPIYVVVHDGEVQWQGWVRPGTKRTTIEGYMIGRGGTLFLPPYNAIAQTGKRFDAMVHLTDGMPCDDWPEKPANVRKAIVALIGVKSLTEVPEEFRVVEAEI